MSEARRREDELREIAAAFGLRLVPRPKPWFRTSRGHIRATAWTALGALFVLVCPATLLFSVSETAGVILAVPLRGPDAEDDENERAVARLVSGRGVRPPG